MGFYSPYYISSNALCKQSCCKCPYTTEMRYWTRRKWAVPTVAWPFRVHGWDLFIEKLFPHHLCLLSQDTVEPFKNRGEDHTCARKRKIIWGLLIHEELSLQECKKLIHTWRYITRKKWKEFSAFCFKVYSLSKAHYDFWKFLIEI